jgi:nucleotide-binding universal stress UspA family protein
MRNIPLIIINVVKEYATVGHSILSELKKSGKRMLHKYKGKAESLDIRNNRVIQCVGNAAEEILKNANSKNKQTLVIGNKGKYGTPKDMLGGTSYKLVHYSNCTVAVVK